MPQIFQGSQVYLPEISYLTWISCRTSGQYFCVTQGHSIRSTLQDVAFFLPMVCFRHLEIQMTDRGPTPVLVALTPTVLSTASRFYWSPLQGRLWSEFLAAYSPVFNRFSRASGHCSGEGDRESLSIIPGASQSFSRAAVFSAQV